MKKILAVILSLILVIGLAACGAKESGSPAETPESEADSTAAALTDIDYSDIKVGLICLHDSRAQPEPRT